MPKKSKTSALVVLSDRELSYTEDQLPKLKASAIAQLEQVNVLHRQTAAHAILAGLTLHRVKASVKRGEFLPWLKGNVKKVRYAQCNFYMRLAAAFIEHSDVSKPDLLALPGDQTSLALDNGDTNLRDFLGKLQSFVGEHTLNDLLDKYGIKTVKDLGGARDTDDEVPAAPVTVDPEVLRLQSQEEISDTWQRARTLLIGENRLQHFVGRPHEVTAIVKGFRDLADEIEAAAKPLLVKAS